MKRLWRENFKVLLGIVIGLILASGGVYAATTIAGSNITYSNTKSGLTSTNIQGAIDELYEKADPGKVINKAGNFIVAYTYNQTSGADNYCVTGKEDTCQKTECYKSGSQCPAGTIIKYKVNDQTIVPFHVMSDNKSKITMQSQRNIINETEWISEGDYVSAGGTKTDYGDFGNSNKGPLTILPILENTTSSWSNVNDQTYSLNTNTGCDDNLNCTVNIYTLPERTAKARLITLQEASSLGCVRGLKSCPIWMYNYLKDSTSYGGTENDSSAGESYWSSSTGSGRSFDGLDVPHLSRGLLRQCG